MPRSGRCRTCRNADNRSSYARNKEHRNATAREWYARNKESVARRSREWAKANPEKAKASTRQWRERNAEKVSATQRAWRLQNEFGISVEEYDRLSANGCAICGSTEPAGNRRRLVVDHDHDSGRIRGLLCNNHNVGLGMFGEDPELLLVAAKYLLDFRVDDSDS